MASHSRAYKHRGRAFVRDSRPAAVVRNAMIVRFYPELAQLDLFDETGGRRNVPPLPPMPSSARPGSHQARPGRLFVVRRRR